LVEQYLLVRHIRNSVPVYKSQKKVYEMGILPYCEKPHPSDLYDYSDVIIRGKFFMGIGSVFTEF